MEVIHRRCAGIDIGKKSAKVCVRVQGSGSRATSTEVTDWGSMTSDILGLREYLVREQVWFPPDRGGLPYAASRSGAAVFS